MNLSVMRQQAGVGLIEVLVTLLVLSTSLIALAALQMRALQFNHDAYLRSQVSMYEADIFDRMRLNSSNWASYNSPVVANFDPNAAPILAPLVGATGVDIAAADINQWRRNIARNLPNSQTAIACNNAAAVAPVILAPVCTVTITWTELDSSQVAPVNTTFTFTARL